MSRFGIVGMWQETNTYSSRVTGLDDFEAFELLEEGAIIAHHRGTESVIGGFIAAADGDELVPLFSAGAWPSGPASAATADVLLSRLDARLAGCGDLDGVLVNLHGAMVTEGHPDMELDTLQIVRSRVGDIPIVCVLDFHANPSADFVSAADVVIGYDTYPHIDMFQRGEEAVGLLRRMIRGEGLRTRLGRAPLLTVPLAQATMTMPMAGVLDVARSGARALGLARVCVTGGFAYSDVERAGIGVLVTGTPFQDESCSQLIQNVLERIDSVADAFVVQRPGPAEAVESALAARSGPVVLADVADNIGGGSAGDGTAILAELLARRAAGALIVIADRDMAVAAHRVGVGGLLAGDLGGKTDDLHGPPLSIRGVVRALSDGSYTVHGSWGAGLTVTQGRSAWVWVDGVDIVVTEFPRPPFHVEQVTHLGIDPSRASVIVAKGAVAWQAAYGDIAASVIEVDGPGVCPIDLSRLPRSTVPVGVP